MLDYKNMDFDTINILFATFLSAFCDEHTPRDLLTDTEMKKVQKIIKNLQLEFNNRTF